MPSATTLTRSYSHRFICSLAKKGIPALRKQWSRTKKIRPLILSWPSQPIKLHDGNFTEKVCVMELPENRDEWSSIFRELIALTSSCGLLLVEQQEKQIRSIVETSKGARCWDLPIVDRGDTLRLGKVAVSDNKESIGLLWRPQQGSS